MYTLTCTTITGSLFPDMTIPHTHQTIRRLHHIRLVVISEVVSSSSHRMFNPSHDTEMHC